MSTLTIERDGPLATLRLGRDHGNAINEALVEDLHAALDELAADRAARGLLLASAHSKIFCPGLDLRELFLLDRERMTRFVGRFCDMYRKLYEFPKPVAAALRGHAVAGGCVLALCADWRVLRDGPDGGAMIGLNEVRLGVGLPWGVVALIKASVPAALEAEVALLGKNFSGREAVEAGLVHSLAPLDEVESAARAKLSEFAAKDPAAFAAIKRSLKSTTAASMRDGDRALSAEFVDLWFSDATRTLVGDAIRALEQRTGRNPA
jgi:enoyl-CoA hydratase